MNSILLVDDDQDTLESIGQLLRVTTGMTVATAHSGPEALSKLREMQPEALVTDFRMPDMDGIELARRAKVELPGLPIVMITAFDDEDLRDAAEEAGICEVVGKPIDLDELLETIDECCC